MATDMAIFTPCPSCGKDPHPTTEDGRCGHCGAWLVTVLKTVSPIIAARSRRACIVCGEGFDLMGAGDRNIICPDCRSAIIELKQSRKRNWVAGSNGGDPDSIKEAK